MKNNIFYYITAISERHCKFSVFSCKNTYELAKTHPKTRETARGKSPPRTLVKSKNTEKTFFEKKEKA